MSKLFTFLFSFFSPVIVFFTSVVSLVAFLLGALANPQGWMNSTICSAIDYIAALFPSTPDNLKIANILNSIGDAMPLVGRGIVRDIFGTIAGMAAVALAIKIYKLLPFKMS